MRTKSVWGVMVGVVACAGLGGEAVGEIVYVSQERYVVGTVPVGISDRRDASNFGPFNVELRVQSPRDDSLGTGIQDSTLGATQIRARGEGRGYSNSSGPIRTSTGMSVMNVVFDVPTATEYLLDGVLRRRLQEDARPTASVELTGPIGQLFFFNFPIGGAQLIDFSGPRAINGVLVPGRYTLRASAFGIGGSLEQAAWFDFTLTVPLGPMGGVLLGGLALGRRRRGGRARVARCGVRGGAGLGAAAVVCAGMASAAAGDVVLVGQEWFAEATASLVLC